VLLSVFLAVAAGQAGEPNQSPAPVLPREALALPPVGQHGRAAVHTDALEARLVAGQWKPPKAGDTLPLPDGSSRRWEPIKAAADGSFPTRPGGGYIYLAVSAAKACVMLLELKGPSMMYVNGAPRTGDQYETGWVRLPIQLHAGVNDLLFAGSRANLRATLTSPKAAALLQTADLTMPDLMAGAPVDTEGAVVVLNATNAPLENLALETILPGRMERTRLPTLLPLGMRKMGFRLRGPAPPAGESCEVQLRLVRSANDGWHTMDEAKIGLSIRRPDAAHKRTFRSAIDGSVQYFAVVPPHNSDKDHDKEAKSAPALVLTLHGAAVEAMGQAACYAPKPGTYVVAPTNRRPYGFDWEDWGRMDALEVLDLAKREFATDPRRTYLTGHSMGGHGVWHLGATYPDHFAAIAPSAGWVSMWSYAGARRPEQISPLVDILRRCVNASDTLALARNLAAEGVYVLHGDKDDNVPVEQARIMKQHLSQFHRDLVYHEEPGMGHWWGKAGVSGAACVDWPPLFDFFTHHTLPRPEDVRQVDFITASPGVSAACHWAFIEDQIHAMRLSSVSLKWDPGRRRFHGTTDNVARLALDVRHLPAHKPIEVALDDQEVKDIPWPAQDRRIWLQRMAGRWSSCPRPSLALKGPHRYGPFKEAFRNQVLFVYGTRGTPEENAWALAKARYDAETFGYRGNASVDVVPDTAFDTKAEPDRNVIVYGHAESNAAWSVLLADSPVQVRRGAIRVGEREEKGEDLGCLFLRPRPGSDRAAVGVVAGSGLAGMHLTDRLPYFISGVGYPDCIVIAGDILTKGVGGIRAAGFFGSDWGVNTGDLVWRN
jgi:predicted esterase